MRFLIPALFGLLLVTTTCSGPRIENPNVILITLDTTRADALGIYGNKTVKTPFLDALARNGNYFTQCFSQAPITLPSHASILTGLNPPAHGVRNNSTYRLDEGIQTLPELLRDHGYSTGAFIGSIILLEQYGLGQGFEMYEDDIVHYNPTRKSNNTIVTRRAEETMEKAWTWIEKQSDPFFSWIHLYDAHWPYEPPPPFDRAYADNPYDGEIAYMDLQIGRLMRKLKESGRWDNTLLIVTADHGESFGEHGEKTHGFFCYDSTTHIPLILSRPLNGRLGSALNHPVRSIDIAPTILKLVEAKADEPMDGTSLYDLGDRDLYAEAIIPNETYYCAPVSRLRKGNFSFYKSSELEMYDLEQDPQELINIVSQQPALQQIFEESLAIITSKTAKEVEQVQLDHEMIELLRSLGYVHDGGTFVSDSDFSKLPSPLASIKPFREIHRYNQFKEEFPYKMIEGLAPVIEEFPNHIMLLKEQGTLLAAAGHEREALGLLRRAVELRVEDPRLHNLLAKAYHRFGHLDLSLKEFTVALELDPKQTVARYNAARVLLEMGQVDVARENFQKVLEQNPKDLFALNNMAYIAIEKDNNPPLALEFIERAFRVNHKHPLILENRAYIMAAVERMREGNQ